MPPPSGAWVTWHLGWWWTTTLAHRQDRPVERREEIVWPGDAESTVRWLRDLQTGWTTMLDGFDEDALDAAAPFPWPPGSDRVVADTLAWANVELMKNVAELGQLALLYRARDP